MQLIIRLDDITPDMDLGKFNKVREILDAYDVKPLIGVVPDCRDDGLHKQEKTEGFWELIHELMNHGWTVAQHGTYHVYETNDSGILGINPFSEFAGLPYEKQYEKLKKGRDILLAHDIHTEVFMAPGHTFDKNTVIALKKLGFSTITDGLFSQCYDYEGIICVPCRLCSYSKLSGLDTVCLHTNNMSASDVSKLEELIKSHISEIIEFDVELFKMSAIACTPMIRRMESRVLAKRKRMDRIANSARLSWYLNYTNHPNKFIKMIKRIIMIPLLVLAKGDSIK